MPSTYTTNLGIEKIGTGEQSGSWGNTTNTNFDLIDQAVNGVSQVTLSSAGTSGSPNTLPVSDGALSSGRNKFVEFVDGGDLGSTAYVQLTPNNAEKVVHIRNSLSGSQSIIVFQGTYSASNDFEIANGADVLLKFDGAGASATVTDVNANLSVTQLTSGNITSSGNIAVTGTVDGRDIATDGTKLDGIDAGAEVNVPTNLGSSATASSLSVTSSTGSNASLPAATTSAWGVMTDEDKTKLDGIASGANNYVHPSYTSRSISLDTSGAEVVDTISFTSDTIGSVTAASATKRTLTLANLGYTGATDADNYSSWSIAASGTAGSSAITSGNTVTFTGSGGAVVTRSGDNITINAGGSGDSGTTNLSATATASSLSINSDTGTNASVPAATTSAWGAMTDEDKTKLDGIAAGAQVNVATNLTYTASTRVIASSTGTNATLTEVVAGGNSGLMTGSDKSKLDGVASGATANAGTVTSVSGGTGLSGSVTSSGSIDLYSSVTTGGTTTLADEAFRTVTSSGSTITLPSSPSSGDTVYISNGDYTNTVIARNGSNIMGLAENMTLNVANIGITLVYSGNATQGWRII